MTKDISVGRLPGSGRGRIDEGARGRIDEGARGRGARVEGQGGGGGASRRGQAGERGFHGDQGHIVAERWVLYGV